MRISRRFTEVGTSPYATIEFRRATSEIKKPDGSLVFQQRDIEVPAEWSQVACDVLAQKYFRKAGVPARLRPVAEPDVPDWLWRHEPDSAATETLSIGETSAKQVFDRLARTPTESGRKGGYFDAGEDARAPFDEMPFLMAPQMDPASPPPGTN